MAQGDRHIRLLVAVLMSLISGKCNRVFGLVVPRVNDGLASQGGLSHDAGEEEKMARSHVLIIIPSNKSQRLLCYYGRLRVCPDGQQWD